MYHGIILDVQFVDPLFPETLNYFAKKKSKINPWTIYGVSIKAQDFERTVQTIQKNMKLDKPYYAHFYRENELMVVFKEKIFRVASHNATWTPVIDYGVKMGIPKEQLDFWPNRFQDEVHYFEKKDFVTPAPQK